MHNVPIIHTFAHDNSTNMKRTDPITPKEEHFIKEHVYVMTIAEIATSLGRNYYTIQRYLKILGYNLCHKWTEKEDAKLRELWENYTAGYICRVLNIDENSVYNRARRLGLKKKRIVKP